MNEQREQLESFDMENLWQAFNSTDELTIPAKRFRNDLNTLLGFITFVTEMATKIESNAKKAAETLLSVSEDEEARSRYAVTMEEGVGVLKALQSFRQFVFQTMLCRTADNFLTYISELLALMYNTRPQSLRSKESFTYEEAFQFESMGELVAYVADERVYKLSHQSLEALVAYLREKLSFDLFPDDDHLQFAIKINEIRNLIVHNRATISKRFLKRIPGCPGTLGDQIVLDNESVFDILFLSGFAVWDIDRRATEKFSLEREQTVVEEKRES